MSRTTTTLTRRGWTVLAVVGFCLVMAYLYGPRSLNAVVAPLLVVLLAAGITVYRADSPSVRRGPIEEGFVGERRTVDLSIGVDAAISGVVEDRVGDGLAPIESGSDGVDETTGDGNGPVSRLTLTAGSRFTYDVTLTERGEHTVGPVSIGVRDVLGLAQRRFDDDTTERVLVYPAVHDLRGASRHDLQTLADAVREYNREEFDHLREYERGDSLRDVHWKSSAKRPDDELVVKEFVADEDFGAVDLVAESAPGRADEMATAAASVATYLLEMGVAVGVTAPDGTCPSQTGREHHVSILRLLARTESGHPSERDRSDADVLIRADEDGTIVAVDDDVLPFDRLCEASLRRTITDTDRATPGLDHRADDDRPGSGVMA